MQPSKEKYSIRVYYARIVHNPQKGSIRYAHNPQKEYTIRVHMYSTHI